LEIKRAYETLKKPAERKEYDKCLATGEQYAGGIAGSSGRGRRAWRRVTTSTETVTK